MSPSDLNPSLLASSPRKERDNTQGVSGVLRNLGEVEVGEGVVAVAAVVDCCCCCCCRKEDMSLSLLRGVVGEPVGEKPEGKASNEMPSFDEEVNRISGSSMPEKSTTPVAFVTAAALDTTPSVLPGSGFSPPLSPS